MHTHMSILNKQCRNQKKKKIKNQQGNRRVPFQVQEEH
jgi:hypothetical protein